MRKEIEILKTNPTSATTYAQREELAAPHAAEIKLLEDALAAVIAEASGLRDKQSKALYAAHHRSYPAESHQELLSPTADTKGQEETGLTSTLSSNKQAANLLMQRTMGLKVVPIASDDIS